MSCIGKVLAQPVIRGAIRLAIGHRAGAETLLAVTDSAGGYAAINPGFVFRIQGERQKYVLATPALQVRPGGGISLQITPALQAHHVAGSVVVPVPDYRNEIAAQARAAELASLSEEIRRHAKPTARLAA